MKPKTRPRVARQQKLEILGQSKDSVELFVQPGKFGYHATTFPASTIWGAHKDDPDTAAYRAALRYFYGKGSDRGWTLAESQSVTIQGIAANRYMATKREWALPLVPEFEANTAALPPGALAAAVNTNVPRFRRPRRAAGGKATKPKRRTEKRK